MVSDRIAYYCAGNSHGLRNSIYHRPIQHIPDKLLFDEGSIILLLCFVFEWVDRNFV